MFGNRHRRLGSMFHQWTGAHQTNGATANYGVGGYASTATPVPVATVCECFGCPLLGLIHNFSQQARPIGAAGGFASASQIPATPMVSTHDMLGVISFTQCCLVFPRWALRAVRKRHFGSRRHHILVQHPAFLSRGEVSIWVSNLELSLPVSLSSLGY